MYIIIAGCGKLGSNLALKLSRDGHDVVIIDNDVKNFSQLENGFNGIVITGLPIDEDVLREANIEACDAIAAVTSDDNMNIMISQIAKQIYNVKTVLTRAYDPEREEVLLSMGYDVVCSTTLGVNAFSEKILAGNKI